MLSYSLVARAGKCSLVNRDSRKKGPAYFSGAKRVQGDQISICDICNHYFTDITENKCIKINMAFWQ